MKACFDLWRQEMVKILKYITVMVSMMFVVGMLPITAFAQAAPAVARCPAAVRCGGAPAPLIGTGLLVGLALGAVLLGTLLINWRRGRSAD
jgi:hypothetical protein